MSVDAPIRWELVGEFNCPPNHYCGHSVSCGKRYTKLIQDANYPSRKKYVCEEHALELLPSVSKGKKKCTRTYGHPGPCAMDEIPNPYKPQREQWKCARDFCTHQNIVCIDCGLNPEPPKSKRVEVPDYTNWDGTADTLSEILLPVINKLVHRVNELELKVSLTPKEGGE